jgi:hypothetical protein
MGGIDGYGVGGEPSYRELEELSNIREGRQNGLQEAADICRSLARSARTPTARQALLRAARKIQTTSRRS